MAGESPTCWTCWPASAGSTSRFERTRTCCVQSTYRRWSAMPPNCARGVAGRRPSRWSRHCATCSTTGARGSRRRTADGGRWATNGGRPSVLLLALLDVGEGVADGADLLRVFVGDLDAVFVLEGHDQLDEVERIGFQVIGKGRFGSHFVLVHLQGVGDDVAQSFESRRIVHMRPHSSVVVGHQQVSRRIIQGWPWLPPRSWRSGRWETWATAIDSGKDPCYCSGAVGIRPAQPDRKHVRRGVETMGSEGALGSKCALMFGRRSRRLVLMAQSELT